MANNVPSNTNIDTTALVNSLYANKGKLEDKAKDAGHLGGISVFGFGIPNQMFGFDMRSKGQKEAQEAPQRYESAMRALLQSLNEALDSASSPYPKAQ